MNDAKLPQWLEQYLESMVTALNPDHLKVAYQDLSQRYHQKSRHTGVRSLEEAQAYIYARLPATYAVVHSVLQKLPFSPSSVVDLGSGPGTAAWAALEVFPDLETIDCVEQDPWMLHLLTDLQAEKKAPLTIHRQDLLTFAPLRPADLAIFCYSLNELAPQKQIQILDRIDSYSFVVLIFPGTPHHFATLRDLRHLAIERGWNIHAPCSHQMACPMDQRDWCHFSERLPRLKHHRHIKNAQLNYEDEKYSYLIISKTPPSHGPEGRIIKRPIKRSGHILFDVCTDGHLVRKTVSKKDAHYPAMKRKEWGDSYY